MRSPPCRAPGGPLAVEDSGPSAAAAACAAAAAAAGASVAAAAAAAAFMSTLLLLAPCSILSPFMATFFLQSTGTTANKWFRV